MLFKLHHPPKSLTCGCLQGWNYEIAKVWFPANCVFVGMLYSSFPSLQLLGVAMVTVLKNLTNLFTISGDIYFYGKRYSKGAPTGAAQGLNQNLCPTLNLCSGTI